MTDLVGYSSVNSRRNTVSITTIPSKSPFSHSSSLNNSLMNTAISSIAHSTATITKSVNDTMRSMSSIMEGEVIHPTISEPMPSTGIQVYVCRFNFLFCTYRNVLDMGNIWCDSFCYFIHNCFFYMLYCLFQKVNLLTILAGT